MRYYDASAQVKRYIIEAGRDDIALLTEGMDVFPGDLEATPPG